MDPWLPTGPNLAPQTWWFLAVWTFAVGACVGSFLNVVIHRLPQGISIVHPGSRCPVCRQAIRWYDNIPIVSWLVLQGRCRNCQTAISRQYPIVEGIAAAAFLALAWAGPLSGGAWFPQSPPEAWLWPTFLFHIVLVTMLTIIAGICWEHGRAFDGGLWWKVLLALALAAWVFPDVLVFLPPSDDPAESRHAAAAFSILGGLAISMPLGALMVNVVFAQTLGRGVSEVAGPDGRLDRGIESITKLPSLSQWRALALAGVGLGWRGVLLVAVASVVFDVLLVLVLPRRLVDRWPMVAWLAVWSCVLIIAGSRLSDHPAAAWLVTPPWGLIVSFATLWLSARAACRLRMYLLMNRSFELASQAKSKNVDSEFDDVDNDNNDTDDDFPDRRTITAGR